MSSNVTNNLEQRSTTARNLVIAVVSLAVLLSAARFFGHHIHQSFIKLNRPFPSYAVHILQATATISLVHHIIKNYTKDSKSTGVLNEIKNTKNNKFSTSTNNENTTTHDQNLSISELQELVDSEKTEQNVPSLLTKGIEKFKEYNHTDWSEIRLFEKHLLRFLNNFTGKASIQIADLNSFLARWYPTQKQDEKQKKFALKAINIYEKMDLNNLKAAKTFHSLADYYLFSTQNGKKAEQFYLKAFRIYKKMDPHNLKCFQLLLCLSNCYFKQRNLQKLNESFSKALSLHMATNYTELENIKRMRMLGCFFLNTAKYTEAEESLFEAIKSLKGNYFNDSEFHVSFSRLAFYYSKLNQHEKAEKALLKAIAIFKKKDPNNPKIADLFCQLAECYEDQNKDKKAQKYLKLAYKNYKRNFGDEHKLTLQYKSE